MRVLKTNKNGIEAVEKFLKDHHIGYHIVEGTKYVTFAIRKIPDEALKEYREFHKVITEINKALLEAEKKQAERERLRQEQEQKQEEEKKTITLKDITRKNNVDDTEWDQIDVEDDSVEIENFDRPQVVVPEYMANKELIRKVKRFKRNLNMVVKGQEIAINKLVETYYLTHTIIDEKDKVVGGSILFVGPNGVGKTYLAKAFAEELERKYLIVNMSEYSDKDSIYRFKGFDDTYKNSTAGVVTSFVDENPDSVIIFDEIDKADKKVHDLFIELFNTGAIFDAKLKRKVSFKNTLLIFTTNVGKAIYEDENIDISRVDEAKIIDAIVKEKSSVTGEPIFSKAIVSRLSSGGIVMFNNLEPSVLIDIAKHHFRNCLDIYSKNTDLKIKINDEDEIISALTYSCGGKADARRLTSLVGKYANQAILGGLKNLSDAQFDNLETIEFRVNEIEKITLDLKGKTKGIMFTSKRLYDRVKGLRRGIDLIHSESIEEAKELLKKDIDFIIIDLDLNAIEDSYSIDLSDISSDGRKLVDYVFEFNREVPIYLLNRNRDLCDYEPLINQGVKGIVNFDLTLKQFKNDILEIQKASLIAKKCYQLRRSNKALTYKIRKKIIDNTLIVEMYDLKYKTSYLTEDNDVILDFQRPDVKFSDVIGCEDAINTLKDFVKYLDDPMEYTKNGARAPRGVLLYGPPGTGKTTLAKALAGEARDCEIIQKSASDFVGKDPSVIEDLFNEARRYAPAIIFIDEIDAIAKERIGISNTEPLLNKLLTELDGFEFNPKKPVLVIAATNYPVEKKNGCQISLDPAFVRRFDRKICIDLPDEAGRRKVIKYFLNTHNATNISEDCINNIASRAIQYSPDNLGKLIEHAIRRASSPDKLTDEILNDSFDANKYGEKENYLSFEDKKSTAIHEAGHALVSYLTGNEISYITIRSRGSFGGYVSFREKENKTYNKQDLLNKICIALAGRVAETIKYGETKGTTTGASEDLTYATGVAKSMICDYGMSDSLVALELFGDIKEEKVFQEVDSILKRENKRTRELILKNKNKFDALIITLMEKQSLTGKEVCDLFATVFEDDELKNIIES